MQPVIEALGALERRVDLSVSAPDIEREVTTRLNKIARDATLPGFRKGKVPLRMIAASYGAQVHAEVLNAKVAAAFDAAVAASKLRLAGSPRVEAKAGSSDAELAFSATFEVMPEVAVADLSTTEVRKATCPVGDAEVDRTLEIMRRQRASFRAREGGAHEGDRVVADFVGTIDGVAFEGGKAENFSFVVGQGRMLPDFEAGLRGAAAGETKSFPVTFPADYHGRDVAGKTAQFEATVRSVEEPVLPALDEEFARSLGIADGSLVRMRAEVKANLEREVAARLKARTKDSVMGALLGAATFELPRGLVENEKQELARSLRARSAPAPQAGATEEPLPPALVEAVAPQAERRVRLGLLVAELVRSEKLQARQDQVRKAIEEVAQSYEKPAEVIQWYLGNRERLSEVESMVTEDNVVAWVLAHARAVEAPVAFDELMGHA
ncbi:MAG TPA: trigger factor [Burkholderiaceae bacterium]|nr:trigger factor [Burkholderiaceae bacterium]